MEEVVIEVSARSGGVGERRSGGREWKRRGGEV